MDLIQIPVTLNAANSGEGAFPGELEVLGDQPQLMQKSSYLFDTNQNGAHSYKAIDPYDDLRAVILTEASIPKAEYLARVIYLKNNPVRVRKVHVSAEKSATLKTLSIVARRRGPFSSVERQAVPLSSLLTAATQNDTVIELPFDAILDGFSCLVLQCSTKPAADEPIMLTLEVESISEGRDGLEAA
jgi:hypothetical protein